MRSGDSVKLAGYKEWKETHYESIAVKERENNCPELYFR